MRKADVDELSGWIMHGTRDVKFSDQPYRAAVPLPVLLTVEKIQKAVPEVFFYVSAPKVMAGDPDPFLMVTGRGVGVCVVERWDEPGFREK